MIRTREQLTDPRFRERNLLVGDRPIYLLNSGSGWGIHVDKEDSADGDRPYFITVGESKIYVSAAELRSLARDILAKVDGAS